MDIAHMVDRHGSSIMKVPIGPTAVVWCTVMSHIRIQAFLVAGGAGGLMPLGALCSMSAAMSIG